MAIIFDMDGTLLDSMDMWSGIGNRYLEKNGIPVKREFRLVVSNKTYNQMTQEFIEFYALPGDVNSVKAEFDRLVEEEYRKRLTLKPGVSEFLKQCTKDRIPMCVATATATNLAVAAFQRLGILDCFDTVISTRDTGINKFDPDIYLRCAFHMHVKPQETTVFEDALYAADTARKAGFCVVGVYDPVFDFDFEELNKICNKTIRSFAELIR